MSDALTDQLDIEEIERVWAAATPGPWAIGSQPDEIIGLPSGSSVVNSTRDEYDPAVKRSDAAAIAKAPEHIAALLAEVKRLRAELRVGGVTLPAMSEREQAACDFAGVRHVQAMKPSEWEDFLEHERGAGKR